MKAKYALITNKQCEVWYDSRVWVCLYDVGGREVILGGLSDWH